MGLSDLGDAVTWGEVRLLIEEAVGDPSTVLGARLAGWAYPASMVEILTLMSSIGDGSSAKKVMPWVMADPRGDAEQHDPAEVAAAAEAIEAGFVFSS